MTVCRSAPRTRSPVAARTRGRGLSIARLALWPERTTADHTHAETDSAEHDRAVDNVGDGEAAHGCCLVAESRSGGRTISGRLVLYFPQHGD